MSDISRITLSPNGGTRNVKDNLAIANITRSGTTYTVTRRNGSTFTFDQQDNNTTYTLTQDLTDGHIIIFTDSAGNSTSITIPDTDTNYTIEADTTNNQIKLVPSSGTATAITVPFATNATNAVNATKATQDESGNNIKASYGASLDINDHTISLKNKNGVELSTVTVPDNNTTYTFATGDANGQIKVTPSGGSAQNVDVKGLGTAAYKNVAVSGDAAATEVVMGNDTRLTDSRTPTAHTHTKSEITDFPTLGTAAAKNYTTSVSSGSNDLVTAGAVWAAIDNLPEPMVFRGSLGTGGTITALPVDGSAKVGDTYKVITAGTYAGATAKVGDTFVCFTKTSSANTWELIPSGDEPNGTVTSIKIAATSPIVVDNDVAITTSGTRTLSHANSGVTAGTYRSVTVNATGHITAGTNPTTLGGYGITDAKIANGVITLGANTITPLISHQTVTDNNPSLTWSTKSKVATIGSTEINVTMPANPNTDRYVNSAVFADDTTANVNGPIKMTLTRAGSDSAAVIANIPKVSSSSAGVAPKGAAVSSQSQTTKFLREDGVWAAPSYTTNTNTTYTIATGDANGQIKVTPSSGSAYNVSVKGLGSNAYSSTAYVAKAGDTMSGPLIISTGSGNYSEGIRINLSSSGYSTLLIGAPASSSTGTADGAFWIGTGSASSYVRKLYIGHNTSTSSTTYFYASSSTDTSPSLQVGGIIAGRGVIAANTANSSTAGGLALYGTSPTDYGIAFRGTGNGGKHGYVQGDWAQYHYMAGADTRGWVFNAGASTGVASISRSGNMVLNGSLTVGGNAANTSGCRMVYNSTLNCLDFQFAS